MRKALGVLGWLIALFGAGAIAAPLSVPAPLQPWQDWVRQGHEYRGCPLLQGQSAGAPEAHVCAWPGALTLAVDADGARFAIDWQVLQAADVPLPGDSRHRPLAVTVGGRAHPVRLGGGQPMLRLAPGTHRIEGRFAWERRPEQLAVPAAIGIVELQLDGRAVALPERREGELWLGRSAAVQAGADSLSLRVYRLLADGVPLTLSSELQLEVGGRAREAALGRALPPGFVPVAIDSPLPALIGPDGVLRVQLRPGSWRLRIEARGLQVAEQVQAPDNVPPWPPEEVWSYQAAPALRSTEPVGKRPVDPQQVGVPWGEALPSFVLAAGDALGIEQRSRGLDPERPHRLRLQRDLWLDFDGGGATARDRIEGRLAQADRLDLGAPWQLLHAAADGDPLLVTRGAGDLAGVELRRTELAVETLARRDTLAAGPASGWQQDFEAMAMVLHLPPGWLLLHAGGADSADAAWLGQWDLLDLFLLALAALLAQRLLGVGFGLLVLGYLVLGYHQPGVPVWTLIGLLLVALLLGLLPAGRLARVVGWLRAGLLLLLIGWALPFAAGQLKLALYPQLERDAVVEPHDALIEQQEVVEATFIEPPRAVYEMAPPPPPAPAAPAPQEALDRVEVSGSRVSESVMQTAEPALDRYPTDAIVQAGPGVPDWGWRASRIDWQGPVLQAQTLRLWLSPPWLTGLLRLLLVGLLGALLWQLARNARRMPPTPPAAATPPAPLSAATAAAALVFSALLASAPRVEAQAFPPEPLLEALRERLLQPAPCVPECAAFAGAELQLDGERLRLALELHAEAETAAPLPEAGRGAALRRVLLDGVAVPLMRRDGLHWLRLPRGVQRVELEWQLGTVDALELLFPLPPARLVVQAEGWEAAGLQEGRLNGDTLQLLRRARAAADGGPAAGEGGQDFPPFVRITRTLMLDLDWHVLTQVQRIAPAQAGFSLSLPLLDGERVLGDDHEVEDGRITVAFAAGQSSLGWRSQLEIGDRLALTAAPLERIAEHWQLQVGPLWHVQVDGVPEIDQPNPAGQRSFRPLPGETLSLAIERPAALPGASVAIDAADLRYAPGQRAADATLQLDLRSTRGGPHVLALPPQAELISVELDGQPLTLRLAEDGRLVLPLAPGEQALTVHWREASALGTLLATPAVELGAPAANLRIGVELPADRWLLVTRGGGIGPALQYWPALLLMLLVALGLGRLGGTPLRARHWLLLGLGFSTVSWVAAAIVAGWLLLLGWRGRHAAALASGNRWWFGLVQLGLLLASGLALLALVVALKQGLLGNPDMQLTGNGSGVDWLGVATLAWFFDRAAGALPEVQLLSLPLWVYKLAILAWALWLANALIGWLRWGWAGFAAGGYWPPRRLRAPAAE